MALRLTSKVFRSLISVESCLVRNVSNGNNIHHFSSLLAKPASSSLARRIQSSYYSTDVVLRDFLKEEIEAEKEVARKQLADQPAPTISGFQVKADEADVTLTKMHNNEKISVIFNVNDCVRPQDDAQSGTMDKYEQHEGKESNFSILAQPPFRVEIEKGGQKLVFECDYVEDYGSEDAPTQEAQDDDADLFNITAVYFATGEITEKVYGASGDILDGTLYDHLLDYLAERGVDNKFADELIHFATHYEHAQYVNLLQKLREFVSK